MLNRLTRRGLGGFAFLHHAQKANGRIHLVFLDHLLQDLGALAGSIVPKISASRLSFSLPYLERL